MKSYICNAFRYKKLNYVLSLSNDKQLMNGIICNYKELPINNCSGTTIAFILIANGLPDLYIKEEFEI